MMNVHHQTPNEVGCHRPRDKEKRTTNAIGLRLQHFLTERGFRTNTLLQSLPKKSVILSEVTAGSAVEDLRFLQRVPR